MDFAGLRKGVQKMIDSDRARRARPIRQVTVALPDIALGPPTTVPVAISPPLIGRYGATVDILPGGGVLGLLAAGVNPASIDAFGLTITVKNTGVSLVSGASAVVTLLPLP